MSRDPSDAANVIDPWGMQSQVEAAQIAEAEEQASEERASEGIADEGEVRDLERWIETGVLPFSETDDPPIRKVEERFGDAILRLRLYRGWSQRDLQGRSGVHQSQISRLESRPQRGLSSRRLFAILRALNVGDIAFLPPEPTLPPTALELMLWGDQWERAGRAADRRSVNRRRSA